MKATSPYLNSDHNTGLRYYENKDIVVFTALKVASRYCDEYFYKNELDLVKEIISDNGKLYSKPSTQDYDSVIEDDILNKILDGNEKRKIIFLYRDPIERFVATLNHFYLGFLSTILIDFERYPLKNSSYYLRDFESWNFPAAKQDIEELAEDRKKLPQVVRDAITDELFTELHSFDINWRTIRTVLENKNGEGIKELKEFHSVRLNYLADIFLNYESERVFDTENQSKAKDSHYSSYIKTYNMIINDKNHKNITIVDIDNMKMKEFFGTGSKNTSSVPYTKDIIRNAIQKSYRFKTQVEEKFNQESKELAQLKLWMI